jgi:exonuclease III
MPCDGGIVMGRNAIIKEAVKLLAWNVQHGGGARLARIIEEISAYDPDVIALTEFRARAGVALCAAVKERGLPYVETTHPAENQNGIAVFSRTPMRRTRPCPAPSGGLVRWLDIDLPEYGFGIGVLHIVAAGSSKKHPTNVAKTRF